MNFGPDYLAGDQGKSCGWFCIDFGIVANAGSSFLVGDTLDVSVFSTEGHDYATWSMSGSSVALVDGDSLAPTVNRPTAKVRVKALRPGYAAIYGQSAGANFRDSIQLRVVDSSSITRVAISSYPTATIKVGEDWMVWVQLSDSVSLVAGYATGFTSSDTTVLARTNNPMRSNERALIVRGRAPGAAQLTVNFRNLTSDTLRFTVIP